MVSHIPGFGRRGPPKNFFPFLLTVSGLLDCLGFGAEFLGWLVDCPGTQGQSLGIRTDSRCSLVELILLGDSWDLPPRL